MRIALDYDGTYTRDPAFWDNFVRAAEGNGHQVLFITSRPECCPVSFDTLIEEDYSGRVIYTSGARKRSYCEATMALLPEVWIDDRPEDI